MTRGARIPFVSLSVLSQARDVDRSIREGIKHICIDTRTDGPCLPPVPCVATPPEGGSIFGTGEGPWRWLDDDSPTSQPTSFGCSVTKCGSGSKGRLCQELRSSQFRPGWNRKGNCWGYPTTSPPSYRATPDSDVPCKTSDWQAVIFGAEDGLHSTSLLLAHAYIGGWIHPERNSAPEQTGFWATYQHLPEYGETKVPSSPHA